MQISSSETGTAGRRWTTYVPRWARCTRFRFLRSNSLRPLKPIPISWFPRVGADWPNPQQKDTKTADTTPGTPDLQIFSTTPSMPKIMKSLKQGKSFFADQRVKFSSLPVKATPGELHIEWDPAPESCSWIPHARHGTASRLRRIAVMACTSQVIFPAQTY